MERAASHRSDFDGLDDAVCDGTSARDFSQVESDMCSMDMNMARAIRAIVDFLDRNGELSRWSDPPKPQ